MANTQITPFQLTDQFTMDSFNQRVNETNIALQNKSQEIDKIKQDIADVQEALVGVSDLIGGDV